MAATETNQRISWVRRIIACCTRPILRKLLQYHHHSTDDAFVRSIIVEVTIRGCTIRRAAVALFDTGSPETLMGRKLAETLGFIPSSPQGTPLLECLSGSHINTIGRIAGRWACSNNPSKSHLVLDPMHYDAVWEVSGHKNDRYDIIFGRDIIVQYGLMEVKPKLAAPATHLTLPSKVDRTSRHRVSRKHI